MIGKLYRPERNWQGSITGHLEDFYVGDVDVVLGGPSPRSVPGFPGVVSTEGMIGVRRGDVRQHDRLFVNGTMYALTGPPQWDFPNELTGTVPQWIWFEAEATY